jgi:hypothetical protein
MSARRHVIGQRHIVVMARAVGGLGWTWSYLIDGLGELANSGRLLATEDEAFEAATAAAIRALKTVDLLRGSTAD